MTEGKVLALLALFFLTNLVFMAGCVPALVDGFCFKRVDRFQGPAPKIWVVPHRWTFWATVVVNLAAVFLSPWLLLAHLALLATWFSPRLNRKYSWSKP